MAVLESRGRQARGDRDNEKALGYDVLTVEMNGANVCDGVEDSVQESSWPLGGNRYDQPCDGVVGGRDGPSEASLRGVYQVKKGVCQMKPRFNACVLLKTTWLTTNNASHSGPAQCISKLSGRLWPWAISGKKTFHYFFFF